MTNLNRIKVVLVEQQKIDKCLVEQLDKLENSISKCCLNKSQLSIVGL